MKHRNILLIILALALVMGGVMACEEKPQPAGGVRERIGFDSGVDSYMHDGADIILYAGPHTTPVLRLDGATGYVDSESYLDVKQLGISGTSGTATPAQNTRRQSVGDLALFVGGTTTPTVVAAIRQAEVEFNRDLDQNARVHINPAQTAVATLTPDAVYKASGTNNVVQVENANATPVWYMDEAGNAYQAGVSTIGGNITAGLSDTTGPDLTLYSDTSGDYFMWDASEAVLNIIGTNATTALNVSDGNVIVADTLNVDGDIDLDGTGLDADVTGAIDLDADAASGLATSAGDVTIESEVASVTIKGDEAAADAVYLDANEAAGSGVSIVVGATGGFNVDGGLADFGGGPYYVADGDNDLGVTADLEVRNDAQITADLTAGTLVVTGTTQLKDTLTMIGTTPKLTIGDAGEEDVTFLYDGAAQDFYVALDDSADDLVVGVGSVVGTTPALAVDENRVVTLHGDVVASELTAGNNAGVANTIQGLPQIKMLGVGAGTNPASQTIAVFDESPTGEVAEVDAGTNITLTADTAIRRTALSTNSVKLQFVDMVDNDGWDATIAQVDLGDMESLAFWIYSSIDLASGDLDVTLDDTNGTDQVYAVGAVTANTWTYVELDINACGANCDTVDGVHFLVTTQGGAKGAANVYVDGMWVWDAVDEEALGYALLQDGVLGVVDNADGTNLAEYTDYLVHYESGNDFLVWITDQSAAYPLILFAYD